MIPWIKSYAVRRFRRSLRSLAGNLARLRSTMIRLNPLHDAGAHPLAVVEEFANYHRHTGAELGSRYYLVHPPERLRRHVPSGIPRNHWRFDDLRHWTTTPGFVAELPGGRVHGMPPAVISSDGALLGDLSAVYGFRRSAEEHPIFLRRRLPSSVRVEGRVAVLASRSADNYYHFVMETLPRLALLEDAGYSISSLDWLWVPTTHGFQREYLALLGIAESQIMQPATHPHILADALVVPSIPDVDSQAPAWSLQFLRQRILSAVGVEPKGGGRRLYLRRTGGNWSRSVRNEEQVRDYLATVGVEAISLDGMRVRDQVALFADASLIVAPHGAALTNLAYASPSAVVVELFAPSYVNVCYWALADLVGCRSYHYLLGEGRAPRRGRDLENVRADIVVDVRKLATVLAAAESNM